MLIPTLSGSRWAGDFHASLLHLGPLASCFLVSGPTFAKSSGSLRYMWVSTSSTACPESARMREGPMGFGVPHEGRAWGLAFKVRRDLQRSA